MAMIKGARYTDSFAANTLIKRDVMEAIFNFKPYQTPIVQFYWGSKGGKMRTGNPKFEIQEDTLVVHTFSPTAAYTGAGTTATLTVGTTNVKAAIVGTMIHNTTTDQNYRVTAYNDGAGTIDVTLISSGTISNIATTDTFIVLGPAFAEGSTAAEAVSTISTFPFNYTQILKEAVNMTGTQMATENYGGSDWVNQRLKATEQFKLKIELSSMFGVRNLTGSGSTLIRFMGGILDSASLGISDRSQFAGSAFASETYFFDTYLKTLFAKGTNEKTLYCGGDAIIGINNFQKVKQQTKVTEKEYGVDVQYIVTPFGRARVVWYPLLEGDHSNWVVGMDRDDYLKYRFLSANGVNRDMQYQENLQNNNSDTRLDQYLAEVGIHLAGGGQGVHRVLYGGA